MHLLLQLAEECELERAIEAMFSGDKINQTENRSVLHTALRNFSGRPVYSDGQDVMPQVFGVLNQMKDFCRRIHNGEWRGYTGKK
jgi:glucose-6-phosphate isomerase (EC 5.3.1.9)